MKYSRNIVIGSLIGLTILSSPAFAQAGIGQFAAIERRRQDAAYVATYSAETPGGMKMAVYDAAYQDAVDKFPTPSNAKFSMSDDYNETRQKLADDPAALEQYRREVNVRERAADEAGMAAVKKMDDYDPTSDGGKLALDLLGDVITLDPKGVGETILKEVGAAAIANPGEIPEFTRNELEKRIARVLETDRTSYGHIPDSRIKNMEKRARQIMGIIPGGNLSDNPLTKEKVAKGKELEEAAKTGPGYKGANAVLAKDKANREHFRQQARKNVKPNPRNPTPQPQPQPAQPAPKSDDGLVRMDRPISVSTLNNIQAGMGIAKIACEAAGNASCAKKAGETIELVKYASDFFSKASQGMNVLELVSGWGGLIKLGINLFSSSAEKPDPNTIIMEMLTKLSEQIRNMEININAKIAGLDRRLDGVFAKLDIAQSFLDGIQHDTSAARTQLQNVLSKIDGVRTQIDGHFRDNFNFEVAQKERRCFPANESGALLKIRDENVYRDCFDFYALHGASFQKDRVFYKQSFLGGFAQDDFSSERARFTAATMGRRQAMPYADIVMDVLPANTPAHPLAWTWAASALADLAKNSSTFFRQNSGAGGDHAGTLERMIDRGEILREQMRTLLLRQDSNGKYTLESERLKKEFSSLLEQRREVIRSLNKEFKNKRLGLVNVGKPGPAGLPNTFEIPELHKQKLGLCGDFQVGITQFTELLTHGFQNQGWPFTLSADDLIPAQVKTDLANRIAPSSVPTEYLGPGIPAHIWIKKGGPTYRRCARWEQGRLIYTEQDVPCQGKELATFNQEVMLKNFQAGLNGRVLTQDHMWVVVAKEEVLSRDEILKRLTPANLEMDAGFSSQIHHEILEARLSETVALKLNACIAKFQIEDLQSVKENAHYTTVNANVEIRVFGSWTDNENVNHKDEVLGSIAGKLTYNAPTGTAIYNHDRFRINYGERYLEFTNWAINAMSEGWKVKGSLKPVVSLKPGATPGFSNLAAAYQAKKQARKKELMEVTLGTGANYQVTQAKYFQQVGRIQALLMLGLSPYQEEVRFMLAEITKYLVDRDPKVIAEAIMNPPKYLKRPKYKDPVEFALKRVNSEEAYFIKLVDTIAARPNLSPAPDMITPKIEKLRAVLAR